MYQLPIEIQQLIYSFDITYYEKFLNCLFNIQYRINIVYSISYKRVNNSLIEIFKIRNIKNNKSLTPIQIKLIIKKMFLINY